MNWGHIALFTLGTVYVLFSKPLSRVSALKIWIIGKKFNERQSIVLVRIIGIVLIITAVVTAFNG
jgi:hypothetical protein